MLPEEFWAARKLLAVLRDTAWAYGASPDVTLYGLLARVAALRHHHLRVLTGIGGPASLNFYAAAVGPSGDGKSTSMAVAEGLLAAPESIDFSGTLPLGSGEGLVDEYMGVVEIPTDPDDEKKTRKVRAQVRHNALFYVDEGETLVKLMERSGTVLGATLRSGWVAQQIGQRNASEDRNRVIQRDAYALGMVIGCQPEVAVKLLADAGTGLPQRVLWAASSDPNLPDVWPDPPGALPWNAETITKPVGMVVDDAIRTELRADHVARRRGRLSCPRWTRTARSC